MRGFLHVVVLAVMLWAPLSPAHAQARVAIITYGTYEVGAQTHVTDPTDPTGRRAQVSGVKLIEQVDWVCARLGVRFGIEYGIDGPAIGLPGGAALVRFVLSYPEPGIVNPQGERFLKSESVRQMIPGQSAVNLYHFEESWEMVPGTWSFDLFVGDTKVASRQFTVSTRCGIS